MNLVQYSVEHGGQLSPLAIPGTFGGMNPSVFIDNDGEILVNVRVVNYILCHSEGAQLFPSAWGPLSYLHPENDQRLVTENYLVRLDAGLKITDCTKVEMLNLHTPMWDFHGLEDARLVQWGGVYYLIGVRRDTTHNGVGRMEYTTLALDKKNWSAREVARKRTKAPSPDDSYCEKNWVPVLDRPFTFIKWHSPVEIVQAFPDKDETTQISLKQGVQPDKDLRGGTQLIRWGKHYLSIVHDVDLTPNYLKQKNGVYKHRLCVWDDDLNLVGVSNQFTFLDGLIEFCVGLAKQGEDALVSFGFQDNAAFILRVPKAVIEQLIVEALNA